MRSGIKVKEIMTLHPVTASPDISVYQAVKKMLEKGVGSLVIVEDGKIFGILTEKDILSKVVAKNLDPTKVKVSEISSRNLITVSPDSDIIEAAKIMGEKNVRRLPVVKDGKLMGLVTIKDLIKVQPSIIELLLEKIKLREESRKPILKTGIEGYCEVCGNYSENLIEYNGLLVCEACYEELSGE